MIITVRLLLQMRKLAFIAMSALIVSGCSEPYPDWTVVDIRYADLPRAVQKSVQRDFPDRRITRVEQSTFESRMSGRPRKYRLFFDKSRDSDHVIYDVTGKRENGFEFWFGRPKAERMQATARMASVVSSTLPARRRLIRERSPKKQRHEYLHALQESNTRS